MYGGHDIFVRLYLNRLCVNLDTDYDRFAHVDINKGKTDKAERNVDSFY